MELEQISFFRSASQRMEWLTERQRVIASNMAHANTPAYKAQDVVPFETMLEREPTRSLRVTHERHLGGTYQSPVDVRADANAWEVSLDGNSVVLEQQTIMANQTFEQFSLASQAYKKGHDLLTLALVGNR